MQRPQPEITLDDILITEELSRRSPRPPNLLAENQALHTLARQLVNQPEAMLQTVVDIALDLCCAGTAGVSLLEVLPSGEEVFRWNVLGGTLSQYVGGTTPRNFSPCGVCLERGVPVIFSHPERYFTYFQEANTPIVEGLVLPLIADRHALGTIWIISHDEQRHFDSEDVRVMTSLADFTAAALLRNQQQTRELLAANAALEAEIVERKQAEEKLRLAQRRLELSLRGANLGVWTYNVGIDEFWADDRAELLHGHAPHEVHNFAEAGANIHPEDRDRAQMAFAQAILNHSKLQIEYRAIWRDGSVRWIASYAEFIPTGDRDEGIFYGVVQDISDRKHAEKQLRESEVRSRALIENLPGGAAFVVDRDLRYLLAEGEALSAAGFKPEDLVGQTIFEVLPPELATYYEVLYRKGLAGESFEHEHDAHDHSYISRGTPLRSSNGEIYAVLAVSYDISDRKQAEVALRESEKKYRTLVSATAKMVWTADAKGNIIAEVPGWESFTGQTFDEYKNFGWLAVLHPDDVEQTRLLWQTAIENHTTAIAEYRLRTMAGDYRRVAVRGEHLLDADGNLRGWVGTITDVEDMRRAAEAEQAALNQLRESEAKYRSLFESIDEGFCIIEVLFDETERAVDYRFLDVNPSFEKQTGIENAIGKQIREIVPQQEEHWFETYGQVATTGESIRFENRAEQLNSWYDVYAFRVGEPVERKVGVLFNDISDRKQIESALRVSEQRLQTAQKAGNVGVWDWDAASGKTYWSETMWTLYGYESQPDKTGDEIWESSQHPEDQQRVKESIAQFLASNETDYRSEFRIIQPNGSVRWIEAVAQLSRDATGKPVRMSGVNLDITDRKQAEAAVAHSRRQFEKIASTTPDLVYVFDLVEERNIFVNAGIHRVLGYSQAQIATLGSSLIESLIHPDDIPGVIEGNQRFRDLGDQEVYDHELRMRHATGEYRWLRCRDAVFERTADGTVTQTIGTAQDITDRKQAEEQLRRTAEFDAFRVKLSDALRSLTDPVEIQAVAARLLGEHLGANQVHYGETIGEYVVINQGYGNGLPPMVGRFRSIDFGERLVADYQAGRTTLSCDVLNDPNINEAERQVITGAGFQAYIAVPLTKEEGWVATLAVHSVVPRNWTTHEVELVQETAERTWAAVERARAEAAQRESEIKLIREQAAREEERQRAVREAARSAALAELDRAKTLFFSNISHEFRTPLTLLLAPLQDALSDAEGGSLRDHRTYPLAPPHRERLELAHRNAMRLLKLVNTLLDFSRIEAGRMESVYEATDLALLTTELASVFRSAIERAGLQLIVDCPPLPEPVYVDREMWEKIVLNLLSNAFKFTFAGEIAVRLHSADDHHVTLQVQDTGTGIPPEELPHLFERFYQVRGAKARTHEGSGIGLALVHELIRLHGGTVDVSSTVGQGTCFTLTIPLGTAHLPSDRIQAPRTLASTALGAAPYVEEARWLPQESGGSRGSRGSGGREELMNVNSFASPASPASPAPTARILLVDDNADMRDYLTRILGDRVQVEAVADGAAALAAATARVPDLVLSDVMMPGLDGFELLQALRADPRTREIPIILLSARAGEESVVEGLEAGADDYLIKPFSAAELVSRVNAHLQMAQLRSVALRQERTINRRKDELLSTVSHELNTPLVAILGWTRLLRANPSNQSMLMKSLDTIERNATLQAKLIQDLLDISRITAGKLRLSQEPVELKSVIKMAIAAVSTAAIAKDIYLDSSLPEAPEITILGDRDRLQQVICNLLTNAIKFTPEAGSVTVELSMIKGEKPELASYAEIRVTDTGIGICADFLPHVFDRFRQAKESDSAKGLGLGLAIARHLVELHNGTIYAESLGKGQGATFIVELPTIQEL